MGTSCGACKFLRRKCEEVCIFAPYFSYEQAEVHFAAVHKVFGASNVSKLLAHLPIHNRNAAAVTISYEAQARMNDPVHGCVSHILALQQQVAILEEEIELLTTQIVMQPKNYYKEAMERLEECLFSDEASVLEELIPIYMTALEEDLLDL